MSNKKKKPELKIVFDTNVIYTGSASYLVNKKVSEFIKNNIVFDDLEVSWFLPDVVIKERIFQMITEGNKFLQPVKKLETLLGHNLNITEDIISSRVNESIKKQLEEHSINKINLKTENVDWVKLINNSVNRNPPFENNDKEKGFRDALILEAFEQLVNESSKTPKSCKIAFICSDKLLNDAAKERVKANSNIRFLDDLTSLKGLINILVSETEETLIAEISKDASKLFFTTDDKTSLYYKENIRDEILKYSSKMFLKPDDVASKVTDGTWYISNVNFVKKVKQRIWWSSPINIDLISYRKENNINQSDIFGNINPSIEHLFPRPDRYKESDSIINESFWIKPELKKTHISTEKYIPPQKEVVHKKGKSKFEVIWGITRTIHNKLINPKIVEVKFLGNEWNVE